MVDLSSLTDEELKEVQEAKMKSAAPFDLTSLSDDELAELQELKAEQKIGTAESTARNLISGVTQGFSDNIEGVVNAGIRKLKGDTSEFSDIYNQELQLSREQNELARAAQPVAGPVLEIGGAIASGLAIPGGLPAQLAAGSVAGIGFGNSETIEDAAYDAAVGGLLTLAGHGAMRGGKLVLDRAKAALRNMPAPLARSIIKTPVDPHPLNKRFRAAGLVDAKNEVMDITSPDFIDKAQDFLDNSAPIITKDIINKEFQKLGVLSQEILENNKNISVNYSQNLDALDEALRKIGNTGPEAAASKKIRTDFFDKFRAGELMMDGEIIDPSNVTFKQAQNIKTHLDSLIYKNVKLENLTDEARLFKNAKKVSFLVDDFTNKLRGDVADMDVTGKLRQLNEKYSFLYRAKDLQPSSNSDYISLIPGMDKSGRGSKMREFLRSLEAYDPEVLSNYIDNLEPGLIQHQLATVANSADAMGVADVFRVKAIAGVSPLLTPMGISPKIQTIAANKVGKLTRATRDAFKVPRTLMGAFQNSSMILSKVSQLNPSLAVTLEDAFADRDADTVKKILTTLAGEPSLASHFEEGMGFEGQFTSPEELESYTNSIKASNLSTRQKRELITQARSTNQIPQAAEPESPFFKIYKAKQRVNGVKVQDY